MKKLLRTTLFSVFFICTMLVLFSACTKDNLVSISLSGKDEILVGDFEYSDYTLSLTYESGKTEEIALDKSMLSSVDNTKFYQEGEQTITVNYGGMTCSFKFTACLYEFDNLTFNDVETTYNGQSITVEVEKNYPEGTTVYYPNGNTFTNAGEYSVYAIVSRRNYITQKLNAKVTIKKADYDMEGVKLEDKTEEYDGSYHTLSITGALPTGVTASYSVEKIINTADGETTESLLNVNVINAGEYRYTVKFLSDNKNYNSITPLTATLNVSKKSYNTENLTFDDVECEYDGAVHTIEATNLPDGVTAGYSVYIMEGDNKIELSLENCIDANKYYITAHFYSNNSNYEEIPEHTATLTIIPKDYDIKSVIYLEYGTITYDGTPHSIKIKKVKDDSEGLPDDLEISSSWYTKNGETVYKTDEKGDFVLDEGGNKIHATEVTDAGIYKYILNVQRKNTDYVKEFTAYLTISKAEYDISKISLTQTSFEYTDTAIDIKAYIQEVPMDLFGNKPAYKVYCYKMVDGQKAAIYIQDIDGKAITEITPENNGTNYYYAEISFTEQNENYNDLGKVTIPFTITKSGSGS